MKNKKRLGFLSAIMGVCISATSVIGTVAFAEGEGQAQEPVYAAKEGITDIAFFKNEVDYFTKDGTVIDLSTTSNKNLTVAVEFKSREVGATYTSLVDGTGYTYDDGIIVYGAAGTYKVSLVDNKGNEDATDDVTLTSTPATVEVVNKDNIKANADYRVKYDVDNADGIAAFKTKVQEDLANLKKDKTSIEIPASFWDIVDLGLFEKSHLVTKVYLAKPNTGFSVVNSSWKSEMSKLTVSANGTYAFYVEIKDCYGNEIVVD